MRLAFSFILGIKMEKAYSCFCFHRIVFSRAPWCWIVTSTSPFQFFVSSLTSSTCLSPQCFKLWRNLSSKDNLPLIGSPEIRCQSFYFNYYMRHCRTWDFISLIPINQEMFIKLFIVIDITISLCLFFACIHLNDS